VAGVELGGLPQAASVMAARNSKRRMRELQLNYH
jgi:hypothetical protein